MFYIRYYFDADAMILPRAAADVYAAASATDAITLLTLIAAMLPMTWLLR